MCYLILIKNMKIHFITSYVPKSKFKLHHTRKICCPYELQYTHSFFRAKTTQGSVLGPILFNIFLNDLFFVLKDIVCNFADDTSPHACDISLDELLMCLEHILH